jgi:hypothetical protein
VRLGQRIARARSEATPARLLLSVIAVVFAVAILLYLLVQLVRAVGA